MPDEKKVFKVVVNVPVNALEDTLNALVEEGYQIHGYKETPTVEGVLHFVVVGFDPIQIGVKHAHAQAAAMGFAQHPIPTAKGV